MTINEGIGLGEVTEAGGSEFSSYTPSTYNIKTGDIVSQRFDGSGRLETRATILTDEGSFRSDFIGSSFTLAPTGTISFTNGINTLSGSGTLFTSEITAGQYIKKTADADSTYVRIATIISDTEILLEDNYSGTTSATTAVVSDFTKDTSGTGASLSVGSSLASIVVSTANATITGISRGADYGPYLFAAKISISQRIANQTIHLGVQNTFNLTPKIYAIFRFSGTVNTTVECVSGSSASASDKQTTTATLPKGDTTAELTRYEINVSNNLVTFLINGIVVAVHQDHIPGPYDYLNIVLFGANSAGVSATTIAADYFLFYNLNKTEVANSFSGEPLNAIIHEPVIYSYSAAAYFVPSATATDVFTIYGSSTRTIKIHKIRISATTTSGSAIKITVNLIKRITTNTGGTTETPVICSHDSNNPSATATVRNYTANPSAVGTSAGTIRSLRTAVTASGLTSLIDYSFGDVTSRQNIILRGSSEGIAVDFNGTDITGGRVSISAEWAEF